VSGDKDWIQNVANPWVEWYDPIRDRSVTHGTFLERTGYFSPAEFVQGKALQGDTGDNVPGIEGIGKDTAMKFMAAHPSVEAWFAAIDKGAFEPAARKSKTAKSLHPEQILNSPEGRAIFRLGMQLMDLRNCPKVEPGELIVTKNKGDRAKFLYLCQRLAFASILREQGAFLAHFPNCKQAETPAAVLTT